MQSDAIEELREQLEDCKRRISKLEMRENVGGRSKSKTKSKSTINTKTKTQKKTKKKVNAYFSTMLKAKKENAASFVYGGKTYVGSKHPKLGLVYKAK